MTTLYEFYKEEFDFTSKMLNTYSELFMQRKGKDALDSEENEYNLPLLLIFGRNLKSLQAAFTLCQNGYGEDAGIVLRSIIEATINFYFILLNPRKHGLLFRRYEYVIELKTYEKFENPELIFDAGERDFSKNKITCKNKISEIELQLQKLDPQYDGSKQKKADDRGYWSGLSIKQMALELEEELQRQYHLTFWVFSGFTHPNLFWINGMKKQESEKVLIDVRPSALMVRDVLMGGICYYSIVMMLGANDIFNLEKRKMIDDIRSEYQIVSRRSSDRAREQGTA